MKIYFLKTNNFFIKISNFDRGWSFTVEKQTTSEVKLEMQRGKP